MFFSLRFILSTQRFRLEGFLPVILGLKFSNQ